MKKFVYLILILSFVILADWERTYTGNLSLPDPSCFDYGLSLIEIVDGGFIICGDTDNDSYFLIRTDITGDTIWTRTNTDSKHCRTITLESESTFIVSGKRVLSSSSEERIWLARFNFLGTMLWDTTYYTLNDSGQSSANQHIGLMNEGLLTTGSKFVSFYSGNAFLMKTDICGNIIWEREYDNGRIDVGVSVIQTNNECYVLLGNSYTTPAHYDLNPFVVKADSLGNLIWIRNYGIPSGYWGASIIQTPDSCYVFAGQRSTSIGYSDVWLVKIDGDGDVLWERSYGDTVGDGAASVILTEDNGFLIAGQTGWHTDGPHLMDAYLIRTDSLGDTLWTRTFGGPRKDEFTCVRQTSDGGFVCTGTYTHPYPDSHDVYLVKIDPTGIIEWESTKPERISLSAHPNPFNSAVTISLDGVGANLAPASVEIFDVNGRRVETLRPSATSLEKGGTDVAPLNKGGQGGSFTWQPDETLPSGVYLVRARIDPRSLSGAEAPGVSAVKRVVYLK